MRKCIDMGEGREIIINDKDMLKPDVILESPDIGLGEAYRGKASYVVYDEEDIEDGLARHPVDEGAQGRACMCQKIQ